jgi:predicted ribosome quality control (RQC) complex YloA/Tae2 family protein
MKQFSLGISSCKLGENKTENWLLLKESKPYHLFMHLTNLSSGFLIIELERNSTLNKKILSIAADICKKFSKHRHLNKVKVDYTPCINVSKGQIEGEVYYKNARKVRTILI